MLVMCMGQKSQYILCIARPMRLSFKNTLYHILREEIEGRIVERKRGKRRNITGIAYDSYTSANCG